MNFFPLPPGLPDPARPARVSGASAQFSAQEMFTFGGGPKMDLARAASEARAKSRCGEGHKKLLGTKGIATRNKDASRGSWPYY